MELRPSLERVKRWVTLDRSIDVKIRRTSLSSRPLSSLEYSTIGPISAVPCDKTSRFGDGLGVHVHMTSCHFDYSRQFRNVQGEYKVVPVREIPRIIFRHDLWVRRGRVGLHLAVTLCFTDGARCINEGRYCDRYKEGKKEELHSW